MTFEGFQGEYTQKSDFVTVKSVKQSRFVPIQTTTVSVEILIIFRRLHYFLVTITFFSVTLTK